MTRRNNLFLGFSAMIFLGATFGCAAEAHDQSEEAEGALSEMDALHAAPALQAGTYKREFLASADAKEGFAPNPPILDEDSQLVVKKVRGGRFVLEFFPLDGAQTNFPVSCNVKDDLIRCEDPVFNGPPDGAILNGKHLPMLYGAPREIDALLIRHSTYTGARISATSFMMTLTSTMSCRGSDGECKALGETMANYWSTNPLTGGPEITVEKMTFVSQAPPSPRTPAP